MCVAHGMHNMIIVSRHDMGWNERHHAYLLMLSSLPANVLMHCCVVASVWSYVTRVRWPDITHAAVDAGIAIVDVHNCDWKQVYRQYQQVWHARLHVTGTALAMAHTCAALAT